MAPPKADVALPRLGFVGGMRWAWTQLTSMRTALLLLLLLAVAAVPGSVLPQRNIDPGAVTNFIAENPTWGEILDTTGFFDVYASVWFSAIYLLLFVSLVGCVLPRVRIHAGRVRARPPRTPRRLERLPAHQRVTVDAEPEAVLAAAGTALRRRRYRVDRHDDLRADDLRADDLGDGNATSVSLAAERGHWRETGNLVFHLALVGVLLGVAFGYATGFRGQVLVVTGDSFANSVIGYDTFDAGPAFDEADLTPFRFTLDSLDVAFEEQTASQLGAPRTFDARLQVQDDPDVDELRTVTVRPNQPLEVDGTSVFLLGNGYAPVVTVRGADGEVAASGPVPALPQDADYRSSLVVKAPDADPDQLALAGFLLPTAIIDPVAGPVSIFPDARDPRLVLNAYSGDLGLDDGVPQSVYSLDGADVEPVLDEDGDAARLLLAPGDTVELPGGAGSVTFEGLERFAAFDVARDPGAFPVLVCAVVAMLGLVTSLTVRRRRVWVRVTAAGPGRTVVQVAGLARGQDAGLPAELDRLLATVPGVPTQPGVGSGTAKGSS